MYSSRDRDSDRAAGPSDRQVVSDRYDAFLFDLDGVFYRGADPVPSAAGALTRLRAAGKRVAFVTNNASATPASVVRRLGAAGVDARVEEIETSALATAALLAQRGVTSAFVLGEDGINEALSQVGITVLSDDRSEVDVVVVGLDRKADYDKIRSAAILIDRGAAFIATNPDGSFPAPGGVRWPGAGALVAAVEATTDVRAEVVGKPNAPIFEAALARAGGGDPLVVGDRIDTDIAGAVAMGWPSMLVLTGISTREEAARSATAPTYVAADLLALFEPA